MKSLKEISIHYKKKIVAPFLLVWIIMPLLGMGQEITITGKLKDAINNSPVPYVSIGVKNKPIGTIADSLGNFKLTFNKSSLTDLDTIVFTSIGYQSIKGVLKDFNKPGLILFLRPNTNLLREVNISDVKDNIKTYGRTPASMMLNPRAYSNFPRVSDVSGREQATILDIDENIVLKEINFLLLKNNYTKVRFRVNIYSVVDDHPDKLISAKDVLYETEETHGWKTIDLEKYNIHLNGYKKVAIALQLIEAVVPKNDTSKFSFLVPSYPSPFRKSFFREKSESEWMPVKSSYLFINILAYKLKNNSKNPIEKEDTAVNDPANQDSTAYNQLMIGHNPGIGKRVSIDSASIYYEIYGSGEPLVLLHGNNESISSFRQQIIPLSKFFKVIAIDSRGQGNSTDLSKGLYTYQLFARDVIQVLDKIGINKANVLGWSDGGNAGLILAYMYPGRVNKLAIFGANLFPGKEAIDEDVIKAFEKRRDGLVAKKDYGNQFKLVNLVLNEPRINAGDLKKINIPVLVMAGQNDAIKSDHTQLISSSINNAKLYIFSNADHYAPLKDPVDFNKVVIDFFQSK